MGLKASIEGLVWVIGHPYIVPPMVIPGIGTASAYTNRDAFGDKFSFIVPKSGSIEAAILYDLDDEGLRTELWLFREDFTATADNAEFAVSDADLLKLEVVIAITNFANAANNQVGINNGLGWPYLLTEGKLWCQCVIGGAANIAAGHIPMVALRLLSYEVE